MASTVKVKLSLKLYVEANHLMTRQSMQKSKVVDCLHSEAKAYIRAVTSLDCGEAKFFAVYKENNLQGKAWICAQGSKTFKCTSGQTHVEAYGSEAQWGDCQWTDPHGHKIGPGTDLVVYRLSKGINADASAKVSATAALWKIVWPKTWVMPEFHSSFP